MVDSDFHERDDVKHPLHTHMQRAAVCPLGTLAAAYVLLC